MLGNYYINKLSLLNNYLLKRDIESSIVKPFSMPNQITLNLSTKCNYNCPICSINRARELFSTYQDNMISIDTIVDMHEFFDYAQSISFMGLLGEPLLNPDFFNIVKYFKKKRNISLFVSTNGQLLTEANREKLIDYRFDRVNISLHGATEETYSKLQRGNFKRVIENLKNIIIEKKEKKSIYPNISVVHALNWWNIYELPMFIDLMKEIHPDNVYIYHYNDYQGIDENISLKARDVEKANDLIRSSYDYAKKIGIHEIMTPKNPPFVVLPKRVENNSEIKFCELPWRGLQLRGCITHPDSLYVGCCNVLNLFRLNYKEYKSSFKSIWHHPVFIYIRETVNSGNISSICKYCKSAERSYLKAIDNDQNNVKKAIAIDGFIKEVKNRFSNIGDYNRNGLTLLEEDPPDIRLELK